MSFADRFLINPSLILSQFNGVQKRYRILMRNK